jgi:hypothetical protein
MVYIEAEGQDKDNYSPNASLYPKDIFGSKVKPVT